MTIIFLQGWTAERGPDATPLMRYSETGPIFQIKADRYEGFYALFFVLSSTISGFWRQIPFVLSGAQGGVRQ